VHVEVGTVGQAVVRSGWRGDSSMADIADAVL
jgi:hypothetical protein